jgi:hypothetical protein
VTWGAERGSLFSAPSEVRDYECRRRNPRRSRSTASCRAHRGGAEVVAASAHALASVWTSYICDLARSSENSPPVRGRTEEREVLIQRARRARDSKVAGVVDRKMHRLKPVQHTPSLCTTGWKAGPTLRRVSGAVYYARGRCGESCRRKRRFWSSVAQASRLCPFFSPEIQRPETCATEENRQAAMLVPLF